MMSPNTSRRKYLAAVGAASSVGLVAGCSELLNSNEEYHGFASEYLLSASEVPGEWTKVRERTPRSPPRTMETGEIIELSSRGGDNLADLGVVIFESPSDAGDFHRSRRNEYEREGASTQEIGLGDRAFFGAGSGTFSSRATGIEVQLSNVFITVLTTGVRRPLIREIAEAQIDAITG